MTPKDVQGEDLEAFLKASTGLLTCSQQRHVVMRLAGAKKTGRMPDWRRERFTMNPAESGYRLGLRKKGFLCVLPAHKHIIANHGVLSVASQNNGLRKNEPVTITSIRLLSAGSTSSVVFLSKCCSCVVAPASRNTRAQTRSTGLALACTRPVLMQAARWSPYLSSKQPHPSQRRLVESKGSRSRLHSTT